MNATATQRMTDHVARAAGAAVLQAIRRQSPPSLGDGEKLLTLQQVADILHCDAVHVSDLFDEGVLTGINIASPNSTKRCLRIHAASVKALTTATHP